MQENLYKLHPSSDQVQITNDQVEYDEIAEAKLESVVKLDSEFELYKDQDSLVLEKAVDYDVHSGKLPTDLEKASLLTLFVF